MECASWRLDWSLLTTLELSQARLRRDELRILAQSLNVEALTIRGRLIIPNHANDIVLIRNSREALTSSSQ